MAGSRVEMRREGGWARIVLTRADKRNAIDRAMLDGLSAAFAEVRDDASVKVVILEGEGDFFSSGIDHSLLTEVFQSAQAVPFRHLHRDLQRVLDELALMEKPVIATLQGAAAGMGFELALAADFRIAEAGCLVGLPEVAFGILPDVGGTTRLTRLLGPHLAKLVILKGTLERADSHPLCGAMTQIVQGREALDGAVVELATALSRHPAPGVGLAKILIDRVAELPEADALRLEGAYQSILLARDDLSEHFMPALSFIREQFKGSKR